MRRPLARTVSALVASAALIGCQPAPSTTPATSAPFATQSAATSPGAATEPGGSSPPSASAFPSLFSIEVRDAPFLGPADGPDGSLWVMPAAGTRDQNGNLVLVIVWFDDGSSPPRITISTSADGTTWDVGTTDIFAGLAVGAPDPGPIPAAIVQLDDGSWQIYGWSAADSSGSAFWSWRTSAASLHGPWKLDAQEILEPGPAGDWDSQMAAAASVLRTEDGFAMWYEGEPPGSSNRGDIGLAASTDGLSWSKADDPATPEPPFASSDPVIPTSICGPSTSVAVEQAQVEHMGEGYLALFGGFAAPDAAMAISGAVSDDGRAWRCGTPYPLLTGDMLGGGDGIHTIATVPLEDGRIGLIAESIVTDHSELWWADVTVAAE